MKGVDSAYPRMALHSVAILCCLFLQVQDAWSNYIQGTFQNPSNQAAAFFSHLVINKNTGTVYIGGVNAIYQLTPNLLNQTKVLTGPKLDNPNCPPPTQPLKCTDDNHRKPTNSYSKVLIVDYASQRLIACWSLFQGFCEKRHLDDIKKKDVVDTYVPVVANNQNASTFAFIAPGPGNPQSNVMYVGVSRTKTGLEIYRDLVPAFCSRQLVNFELAFKSVVQDSSKKTIETQHRDMFPIKYVYGFGSENFSYMLTVQKAGTQSENYVSKIFRVCQNDKHFFSYAEIPLVCKSGGTSYNLVQAAYVAKVGRLLAQNLVIPITEDVLYAVFAVGNLESAEATARSALCIYPLRNVRKIFTENIRKCFQGLGNIGPEHLTATGVCQKTKFVIHDSYCGAHDINQPIAGEKPIKADATYVFRNNATVSSVAVSITHEYTVAFIGTSNGHIQKVAIDTKNMATMYEDITVSPGSRVNPDSDFDLDKNHLYVLTMHKLSKLRVQDCERYRKCSMCLGAKDPYCGWCTLENKCSLRSDCSEADQDLRWLPYIGQQCSTITSLDPAQVQILKEPSKTQMLKMQIMNLPQVRGTYQCAFGPYNRNLTFTTLANLTTNGAQCETPLYSQLPAISTGQDHIVMKLSVRVDGKDFVSINFTFFDCTVHESCTHCTQSNFPCNWCIRNHICTKDAQKNCKSDHIVSGKKTDSLGISGPHFCPRITYRVNVIPVPAGIRKKISLNAINLKDFQTDIKCIFKMNTWKQVPAITASLEIIECKSVLFSYIDDSAYHNVPFEITWGEHHRKLDNPKNIQVKMYKCDAMAKSCGACLTMDGMYECGWCENKCSIQHQCETQWHPSTYTCPNPNIFEFTPHKGPVQGGTPLTIKGENLGKKFHDISNGIKVAGIRCKPIEKQYRAAEKIVCETGRSDSEKSGKILVVVANDVSVASDDQFHYVNPHADSITPSVGPMDGGTLVTIKGEHLNTGANFFVNISDFPCKLYNVSEKVIMCSTSASSSIVGGSVKMSFDGYLVISASAVYHYVGNPGIEDVEPKKSISSGGLPIQVFGSNFSIIQRPEMILWVSDKPYYGPCTMLSDVRLDCYSPNITEEFLRSNFNAQPLAYGFRMDNVTSLLNLTNLYGLFQVFSDPQFTPFPENVKSHQYTNEYLTINGKNLNSAIREKQVIVRIGKDYCNVTSLAATQLTCQPPKVQPESATNKDYPEVIVQVGRNLSYHIGFLRYEEPEGTSLHMVIGLAVGGGVLLMIVIIVVIAYRVKSQQSTNMKKQLQIQMDQLESKVAKECKEAFAELQTDMTELTSDLSGQVAIPFWDYRTYCMNVLFPGVKDHPVTKVDEFAFQRENPMNPNDKGLKNFLQLMKNKTFLLIFIRSLEANKQFTMRDRVNVASLISVTLQGNMEYATDILKTLVAELIERSVEGTNHPKLLLRRTESVAEKMLTNWFTFLLFRFLKDCAGEPLFLLFQAIKQQVSKGPVDAITSEARYSLSEDKLIRQQIDFRQMSVNVYDLEQFRQPHQAKVLDCDTITQVKEKILDAIYKNAPFSSRPAKDNLHLEWHVGPQQILILQDEDNTSKIEGDFRRLNTLAHYKVPDGAYMALRMKQSTFNTPVQSEKSVTYKYDNSSLNTRSPSLNRTVTSQSGQQEMESGVNKYHLVKQHDSPTHREGDRGSKMVSEIYLTRLLATKGTLQQFVDDLFERIFSTAHRGHVLPLAIKYVFDFLDDQAMHHNIDSEVVHTWKSNSLPLRFWVNIIKNPNFVFNIYKSNIVDSCLSVVAQTFMDSCSMSEHRLGKDSPSSKLLYAKDIPKYKRWVERYYQDIRVMPAISDQDMNAMLSDESRYHEREFNTDCALLELYEYVKHYNKDLVQALDEDEFGKKNRLSAKLEQVHAAMETTATYC